MSFAFASYNAYGIVVSADRCLTGTSSSGERYTLTNNGRKLFLSKQGFAVAFTGCSSVAGFLAPAAIPDILDSLDGPMRLTDFSSQFVASMSKLCRENMIFLIAGYQDGTPQIYTATTQKTELVQMEGLAYSGESDLGKAILCAVPVTYGTMTLQDRIDFHRFVTKTISNLQSYSDRIRTVSEACDVVAIEKQGIVLSAFSELR